MSLGHTLDEIRQALRTNSRLETLLYLGDLSWEPSPTPSDPDLLHIGTCDGKKVFATYIVGRRRNYELKVFTYGDAGKEIEITTMGMYSVTLLRPFSHVGSRVEGLLAQRFRTYLRGYIALKGHTGDTLVNISLQAFTSIASLIEEKRTDIGNNGVGSITTDQNALQSAAKVCSPVLHAFRLDSHIYRKYHRLSEFKIIPTELRARIPHLKTMRVLQVLAQQTWHLPRRIEQPPNQPPARLHQTKARPRRTIVSTRIMFLSVLCGAGTR